MSTILNGHIEITSDICGGRPRIAGHRVRVQDVVEWHERQSQSAEEIVARFPQLTLADIYAALTYYFDNRDLIEGQMIEDERFSSTLRSQQASSPLAKKLAEGGGHRDPLSSG